MTLKWPNTVLAGYALALLAAAAPASAQVDAPSPQVVPVTVTNFARAESDGYFTKAVRDGAFGQLQHDRAPVAIDKQDVIRMNRDTLYSSGVFDLDAGPVTIVLPDTGKRFMSLLVVNQDHYTRPVVYAPGNYTFTRKQVGTRYMFAAVRTLANPTDPADVSAANAAQDRIQVNQAAKGRFEIPDWDEGARDQIREALLVLAAKSGATTEERFGARKQVDPVQHLLFTAAGWGGNPREAAVYTSVIPQFNDGTTVYRLTVRDVPVDGFWSISVYNAKGFFEKNPLDSYSLNNLTAKPSKDGVFTVQFGGCTAKTMNCLVTPPGWSYVVRQYRPRRQILDGTWRFPEAQPAQ
jgi:para-nitrobenzyl esterase